jgi:hypothetical protein
VAHLVLRSRVVDHRDAQHTEERLVNEAIPGGDPGTEFLSEADLPFIAAHPSLPPPNSGSAGSLSRESHENTTAHLTEIAQAALKLDQPLHDTVTRSTATATPRPERKRRISDFAILAILQSVAVTASAAAAAWFVLVGTVRGIHRAVFLVVQFIWRLHRPGTSGLEMGQRPARARRSRLAWPAISPVAAAFLGGVAVGATAMRVVPYLGTDSAVAETDGKLGAELQLTPADRPVRGTTGTPMASAVPVAAQGIVQFAALAGTAEPGPDVANASEKPVASRRGAAALPEATATQPRFRGSLTVRSHPAGASVFVNGRRVGNTPLVLRDQTVGSRSIRITLDGHEVWTTAARVVAYQQSVVEAHLRQLPAGPTARQ